MLGGDHIHMLNMVDRKTEIFENKGIRFAESKGDGTKSSCNIF
jgi:hypothetical protein